MLISASI